MLVPDRSGEGNMTHKHALMGVDAVMYHAEGGTTASQRKEQNKRTIRIFSNASVEIIQKVFLLMPAMEGRKCLVVCRNRAITRVAESTSTKFKVYLAEYRQTRCKFYCVSCHMNKWFLVHRHEHIYMCRSLSVSLPFMHDFFEMEFLIGADNEGFHLC